MRVVLIAVVLNLHVPLAVRGQEKPQPLPDVDKQIIDVLKDVHNRGADLFNTGDPIGCYRLFQGSLLTAKAVLGHRPSEQKLIDDLLADAEREPTVSRRAFVLHESIEKLRARMKGGMELKSEPKDAEILNPPREVKKNEPPPIKTIEPEAPLRDQKKEEKKEPLKLTAPPPDGVMGRLHWKGQPLPDARLKFVRLGEKEEVVEGRSDTQGLYLLEKVPPGKYTVLLSTPDRKDVLPERYAAASTSPLVIEVKGGGDTVDFMLQ